MLEAPMQDPFGRSAQHQLNELISTEAKLHTEHVDNDVWFLESCEYCRGEYFMLIPPLGAD